MRARPFRWWMLLIMSFGIGPSRAWRLIREQRAAVMELEDTLAPIPDHVSWLYFALGPWSLIVSSIITIFGFGMFIYLSIICLPGGVAHFHPKICSILAQTLLPHGRLRRG